MQIVICPKCLSLYNLDEVSYMGGTYSSLATQILCPHCHGVFAKSEVKGKQEQLKKALKEYKNEKMG